MSWVDLYEQELGIDRNNRQQLFDAVRKDIVAEHHGDKAAKRRLAAYERAHRAWEKKVKADDQGEDEADGDDVC